MNLFDINGWEFLILIVLGIFILGPERLPHYAARLAQLARQAKAFADAAQAQLKDQLGPEFQDVDWAQYDPRQYDPRRIVREALGTSDTTPAPADPAPTPPAPTAPVADPVPGARAVPLTSATRDPELPTPWDVDAT